MAIKHTQTATTKALSYITSTSVPSDAMLEYTYGGKLPTLKTTFKSAFTTIEKETNNLFSKTGTKLPSNDAYNNCHGRWSEALFALFAWNTLAKINKNRKDNIRFLYVKLPDRKGKKMEWTSLLLNKKCLDKLDEFILDNSNPSVKKTAHNRLLLIASNPDAVILKYDVNQLNNLNLPFAVDQPFSSFTANDLATLDSLYKQVHGSVLPSENLVAFLSVKSSIRGDRRYQFIREGDNAKSVLMYLFSTRTDYALSTDFFSKCFFCFCFDQKRPSKDDLDVMDAAMSAYVSSPIITPMWAIDKYYICPKLGDVSSAIRDIINLHK